MTPDPCEPVLAKTAKILWHSSDWCFDQALCEMDTLPNVVATTIFSIDRKPRENLSLICPVKWTVILLTAKTIDNAFMLSHLDISSELEILLSRSIRIYFPLLALTSYTL